MFQQPLGLTAVLVLGLAVTSGADTVFFGDSLSDTGNLFLATGGTAGPVFSPDPAMPPPRFPTPPYVGGRASDGPVWIEHFALGRGEPAPLPHLAGGTNYAYIGATTGPQTASPFGVPDVGMQVQAYLTSGRVPADDLFVLFAAANDFIFGQGDPSVPVDNMADHITALQAAGATKFLVLNLPRLGDTPYGAAVGPAGLNSLTEQYNDLLHGRLASLRAGLGVTIHEVDLEAAFGDVLADPAAYGLTNVSDTALTVDLDPSSPLIGFPISPTSVVPNASEYLFFDGVHPTTVGHGLIADAALGVVPEPSSALILFSGAAAVLFAVGLGFHRRSISRIV
jgi:phospholipase/lecithinase/hemolysin